MNELIMSDITPTDNILEDMKSIIDISKQQAFHTVNLMLIRRNWLIGHRIATEEMCDNGRAEYGTEIISKLAKQLTNIYGKGFTKTNLYSFYNFYKSYPQIFQTASGKLPMLSWSHYNILLQVNDPEARAWYENEAISETWSVRTLQRNIFSQYYYRILKTQNKSQVHDEMTTLTSAYQDKLEFIKNPVIAEFLGFSSDFSFTESKLESAIIANLQKFLM